MRLIAVAMMSFAAFAEGGLADARAADANSQKNNCKPSKSVLGVSRTITINTKGGPKYGLVNYQGNELLKDKEVLLTFDDGPLPTHTNAVLKALAKECTRATFFAVGRMSVAFPKTVKRIMAEGHTLGTHTWSHGNLARYSKQRAVEQFERGIAAIEAAAGKPIAPVFRFPYLARTKAMEAYISKRNVAIFSIDIDSRDTRRGISSAAITAHTIARLKRRGKGIVLFHDIKRKTAAAVGPFLRQLRKNGFKIVHLKTSSYTRPLDSYAKRYNKILADRAARKRRKSRKVTQTFLRAAPVRNPRALKGIRGSISEAVVKTTRVVPPPTAKPKSSLKPTAGIKPAATAIVGKTTVKSKVKTLVKTKIPTKGKPSDADDAALEGTPATQSHVKATDAHAER